MLSDSLLKYLQSGVIDITTLCNINPMLSNCILKSVGRNVFDNMSPVLSGYTLKYSGSVVLYFQTATDRTNKDKENGPKRKYLMIWLMVRQELLLLIFLIFF